MLNSEPVLTVRRQMQRAARHFDRHRAVFDATSERLLERLDYLAVQPKRVLDLGCRSGYQLDELQRRYPDALVVGADLAPPGGAPAGRAFWHRWRRRSPVVCAVDPHHLPFADGAFDLVVSNLMLPWCESFEQVFREIARVLVFDGAVLFSSAGPDTLIEYRRVWADIDAHLHAFGLFDMHDLGDAMLSAGLAEPVLDRENLVIDYPDIDALQAELRALGAANLAQGRRKGLMQADVRERLRRNSGTGCAAEPLSRAPQSTEPLSQPGPGAVTRFPVTLELLQGHAWKGRPKLAGELTDEGYSITVEAFRRSLRSGK